MTSRNPKRTRVGWLVVAGALSITAWGFLMYRYAWTLRWVGIAAIGVTIAMMAILLRSYITRRGISNAAVFLSLFALILGIVAMALVVF